MPSRRAVLAALALPALTACAGAPPPRPVLTDIPPAGPTHRLAVRRVRVEQAYRPPGSLPNVEHLFQISPARMAENWAQAKLVASGGGVREAVFVIRTASVLERSLPRTGGLRGAFTTDQGERYVALLDVVLDIVEGPNRVGQVSARIERSQSAAENLSINEREDLWHKMLEAIARDLEGEMARNFDKLPAELRR